MIQKNASVIRITLLVLFAVLIGVFVFDQYDLVRDSVRFICVSCLGLGG